MSESRIVCQFSCGAASAVATKLALAQYGDRAVIVNAFIQEEHCGERVRQDHVVVHNRHVHEECYAKVEREAVANAGEVSGAGQQSALNVPQPKPKPVFGERAVWDLVMADMRERDDIGTRKYGQRLVAGDGRDSLIDAYQEALDIVVYLRKAIREREIESGAK